MRHDAEAERRDEERGAEAGRFRERREVGVEEVDAGDLERVRGADHEPDDPGIDGGDRAERPEQVDAPLDARVDGPRQDEQPDADDADEQRERGEERPARDVVAPRHPGRADRLGRRRRVDADAEGEDAGSDVPVGGELAPAHGVRLAPDEPLDRDADHGSARRWLTAPETTAPVRREDDDRVGRRRRRTGRRRAGPRSA